MRNMYIDVNGVIANHVKAVVELYNYDFREKDGFREVQADEINTWEMRELSCATKQERYNYFTDDRFFDVLNVMPDFERVITNLYKSGQYTFTLVTLGSKVNLEKMEKWLKDHVMNIGIPMKLIMLDEAEYNDKSSIDMAGVIFIDDKLENLETSNAKTKIVFGRKHGYNEQFRGIRLIDWEDIEGYFIGW